MTETANSIHPTQEEARQSTAVFMPKTDENGRELPEDRQRDNQLTVHFNPETLDITFTNTIQPGRRNQPAQVSVTDMTAKLSMELLFDTTLNGLDVRTETNKLACMMNPAQAASQRRGGNSRKIPSIVIFHWGTIWFEGYIDTYRERIDYFSAEGVPLRATVSVSLTQQERTFQPNANLNASGGGTAGDGLTPGSNAPINRIGSNRSVADAVKSSNPSAGGNSALTRYVAAANGIENIRLPDVNELIFPDAPPSGMPGFGVSFGASGAGPGVQVKGETANLFSNLKVSAGISLGAGLSLNAESHFNAGFGSDAAASAGPGGSQDVGGSSSMSADVGVSADIELGIKFEER